jgi:hypothetical protein
VSAYTAADERRFWAHITKTDGCWLWSGATVSGGYGYFVAGSKKIGTRRLVRAHRFAYEVMVGAIPPGHDLDHLCRVVNCVNPAHLEPVTHRENLLRGTGASARNASKTHCSKGHPYDEANTGAGKDGRRYCKACNRAKVAHYKRLRRERAWQPQEVAAAARDTAREEVPLAADDGGRHAGP